jgi:hypothetical protein
MHTKPPMHEMSSSHPVVIQSSISRGRFLNASSMGRAVTHAAPRAAWACRCTFC